MDNSKSKKRLGEILILFILVLVGLSAFFYKLSSVPLGYYVDEALHSYSAYSILLTGKDEYGKFLPLVFRFYGSFNAPLYIYLTTIPLKLFGLGIFSGRFIAALSGFLSIFVFYLFLKRLNISTISSIFYAIIPWLVFESRIGDEVSLAFLLFSLGSLLLFVSLKNIKILPLACVILSISTYAAYAERFLIPFLLIVFLIVFNKWILNKENRRYFFYSLIFLVVTQIPNLWLLTTPAFFPKSDLIGQSIISSQAAKLMPYFPGITASFFAFIREFLSQYINYLSPGSLFLFTNSDLPGLTVFYSWMIIPFFLGMYFLGRNKKENYSKFIFILLILSPIPAALTKDPFLTRRAMPMVLPIFLIVAFGINRILAAFSKIRFSSLICSVIIFLVFVGSVIFLWRSYFVFFTHEKARQWQYGYEDLALYISSHPNDYFIIDQGRHPLPHVELAFFLKFPPSEFQKTVDPAIKENYYKATSFNPDFKFGNIETRNINWDWDVYHNQILVGDDLAVSHQQVQEHFLTEVFEIKDPMEQIVFVGYKTNPKQKCMATNNFSLYCKGIK